MVAHMKTTVEIPDPVLSAARDLARREGTTVKSLIERGLRRELAEAEKEREFRLRRASFGGKGLRTDNQDVRWDRLRELAYEDVSKS
jgi:hypothetical protein